MSREKALVKKTAIYAAGNFGSKILSYLMVLVYSYFINPDDLGYYDLIITTIAMIQPVIMFEINDGAYRFLVNESNENRCKVIGTSLRFLCCTTAIAQILLFMVSRIYSLQYIVWIALYMCLSLFYTFLLDAVRGMENSRFYAFIGVLNSLLLLLFETTGLVVLNLGVLSLLISRVLAFAVCIVVMFIAQKGLAKSFTYKADGVTLKELLKYSGPLVPNTICWWVVNSSDRYIILFFLGTASNGLYSMSNKFPTIITMITGIFYLAWQELAIKEYHTHNRDKFFSNIFNQYSALLFTLCACVVPATKIILQIFVADAYKGAWKYTGFLYLAAIFSSLCSFLGMGYQISKETNRSIATTVFAAILNIGINVALINVIGLQAASFSTLGAYVFLFIIRIFHTKRYFTLKVNWKKFIALSMLCVFNMILTLTTRSLTVSWIQCFVCFGIMICINLSVIRPLLLKITHKFKRIR